MPQIGLLTRRDTWTSIAQPQLLWGEEAMLRCLGTCDHLKGPGGLICFVWGTRVQGCDCLQAALAGGLGFFINGTFQ